jgi:hypothetical protein
MIKLKDLLNESASRTAMEIGGYTGLNKNAVQKFVDDNNLDIEKVFQYVKKGKLPERMDLVTAIAGRPGNPIQKKMIKMFTESVVNEDANMNKKVKQLLDKNLKELTKGKPNHQFAVMHILMGALSDANFHSEAKQVAKLFPKAKYEGDPMAAKDVEEYYHYELGPTVANICKWDGKDIVDAIGFYVSMTIGRPVGEKVEKLVESVNEATDKDFEKVYSIFDKKDYFGLKGSIKTMLGNWQRALDKGDKGAERYSKEDIIKHVTDSVKDRAKQTYDELVTAIKNKDIKALKSKLRHDQKFSLAVFAQVTGKTLPKSTRDIQSFLDNEFMNESINEADYQVYHKSFTDAADAARKLAEKRGFEIDEDDWQTQVALGGKNLRSRPSVGKETRFTVGLLKGGKPQRKALSFQVYGMKNGYELNAYIN